MKTNCLGNHEFDDGPPGLVPFLEKMVEANVTVLGTNLDTSNEPLFKDSNITLPKSIVYNISGTKVAVLGVVTTETITIAKPGGVKILPEVESINAEIERLKNESGINIFFLVSHVGFDVDQVIAQECPELDLIVGGHTNTFLYTDYGEASAVESADAERVVQSAKPGIVSSSLILALCCIQLPLR
ncbi:hypothetical protein HPB50_028819 [Hyalomma asiaticum]|nr:hypothetical protein HPB50_028819 [Hyalomma asiaticum]